MKFDTRAFLIMLIGFWIGVLAQDSMYFFQLTDPVEKADLLISGMMLLVNFLLLMILKVHNQKMEAIQDLGLPDEEELSTDAEYSCSFCGDPVKKGDRVLQEGKTYCTREHAEEDN